MAKTTSYRGYADAVRRFDIEPSPGRERNRFNYLFKNHLTFDAGMLIPFFDMDVLPGDDIWLTPRFLTRLSGALVSPLMDEIIVNVYFFLGYNRFVMEDWNAFMGEHIQQNPDYDESGDNVGGQSMTTPPFNAQGQYELPTLTIPQSTSDTPAFPIHSLYDYMDLPYDVRGGSYEVQTLKLRLYNLIYNEYFRNENIQDFAPVPKSIGPDKMSQYQLMPVTKYQDYFTGSLPFLQKGPNVAIGLTGDIPVIGDGNTLGLITHSAVSNDAITAGMYQTSNAGYLQMTSGLYGTPYGSDNTGQSPLVNNRSVGVTTELGKSGLIVAAAQAQAVALAQIRLAFQLQRFYEGQARSGTRYIEYINFMFNEYIPDVQLQRPKYLGGGKFYININPVAQTSATEPGSSSLGTLAAFGSSYTGNLTKVHCHANEHGYIFGLLCVRTNLSYQQGLRRDWSYRDRLDFYTPTLAHLAEQAVKNKEICTTGISAYDEGTWGYIGRYDEYRTRLGRICGRFRNNAPGSLSTYHLGQFFDTSTPGTEADGFPGLPHLNAEFLKQPKTPIDNALELPSTTPTVPQFLCDCTVDIKATRVVSKYGIPGFADHF